MSTVVDCTPYQVYHILQIIYGGKSFAAFADQSEIAKLAIGSGYTTLMPNRESYPANYSLISHTAKVFHLKRFAKYGMCTPH